MSDTPSKTPRTKAELAKCYYQPPVGFVNFTEQLEQENATLRAERDDAQKTIHEALAYFHDSGGRSMVAGDTIPQMFNALTDEMDDAKTERDEARKEAATLRELAEGLKADKERLDWLDENVRDIVVCNGEEGGMIVRHCYSEAPIRADIDAARYRAACPGEGQPSNASNSPTASRESQG
jgi:hypothetical protein